MQQEAFYKFLDKHQDIFLGLVKMLMDGLNKAIDSIQPSLQDAAELAEEVELSMSTLWDTVPEDADVAELTAQKHLRETVTKVQKQLSLWTDSAEAVGEKAVGETSILEQDVSSSSGE
ncbi:hypothetical protein EWM64_g9253 [Hericium alpestre]|uniref:Uncharacterized protein n=1 Tax=Hericium alpestre TaxID=135208 RepID=A0A4Y9ZKM9_9AGAM|nr:hypothetical protein EWM64_g9253 [Hericium alpestre]